MICGGVFTRRQPRPSPWRLVTAPSLLCPDAQGLHGPIQHRSQTLRGRRAVDHCEQLEVSLPAWVVHALQPSRQPVAKLDIVGAAEELRVVRRELRDNRGGLG